MQVPPKPFEQPQVDVNQSQQQFYYPSNCKSLKHRCEMWESWGYPREQIEWCKVYDRECATEVSVGFTPIALILTMICLQSLVIKMIYLQLKPKTDDNKI